MIKKIALVSIIDDDHFFQYSTKRILERSEKVKDILQFYDGEEAIDYLIENKNESQRLPNLIFLDLNMPFMDGWQFLDAFTTHKFSLELITIYICTSSTSIVDKEKFNKYPKLNGYLIKPISKHEFSKTLERELIKH